MPRPACFLDRQDLERIVDTDPEGVAAALDRLREAGFVVVAASNESTVASGARTEQDVQEADRLLAATLAGNASRSPIDRFYWCPFTPDAEVARYRFDHPWRKPRPGMLLQAAEDLDLDLATSWMLAGRDEDLAAARVAGMRVAALGTIGDGRTRLDLVGAVEAVLHAASEPQPADADAPEVEVLTDKAAQDLPTPDLSTAAPSAVNRSVAVGAPAAAMPESGDASASSPSRPGSESPMPTTPPTASPGAARSTGTAADASRKSERGARRGEPRSDGRHDEPLLAAIRELTEELRQSRAGARELSGGRVVALLLELCVLLAAAMGLVQLAEPMLFAQWFAGAVLLQLAAIALLLFDRR